MLLVKCEICYSIGWVRLCQCELSDCCCSVLALVIINALLYCQLMELETTVADKLMLDRITVT